MEYYPYILGSGIGLWTTASRMREISRLLSHYDSVALDPYSFALDPDEPLMMDSYNTQPNLVLVTTLKIPHEVGLHNANFSSSITPLLTIGRHLTFGH